MKSYCLDCKERHNGCHATCYKYKEYKEELEKIKTNIKLSKLRPKRKIRSKFYE